MPKCNFDNLKNAEKGAAVSYFQAEPARELTIKWLVVRTPKAAVLQPGQLALASDTVKLMLALLAAVARLENALLVERT